MVKTPDGAVVVTADNFIQAESYSFNNLTAQRDTDGRITIQFGGCDGATGNCLPTTPGWNYLVRLYPATRQDPQRRVDFPCSSRELRLSTSVTKVFMRRS
jgi:hypothetical protein